MTKLSFATTGCYDLAEGFGCASLGFAGVCDNSVSHVATWPQELEAEVFTGSYDEILSGVQIACQKKTVQAAVVVFGNAGGENEFLQNLQKFLSCPVVGGGAAIDGPTGRSGLIPGNGPAAVCLITDDNFTYTAHTQCIHDEILGQCQLTLVDPRTILTINGMDAVQFLREQKGKLGLPETDFEHLTLSDLSNVNAHLSMADGVIKSGRDLQETMLLRYVAHEKVYETMRKFYDDPNAIVFGCAGLSGLLDKPLDTDSLGLFLFGEVCMADGRGEFGNLMLSKLVIKKK